jgi:LysR family nod box-dependent transcriptional activator
MKAGYGAAMPNLRKTNLNLLPVLRELLRHQNVTNAARALNLSQPAVSKALAQLRGLLHDELLIPNGRALQPSALAERMLPHLEITLGALERLISPVGYDPATSRGVIKIAATDYVILLLGAELIKRLSSLAPHLTIEFVDGLTTRAVDLRTGDVDLFISPGNLRNPELDEFSNAALFDDEIACIVDRDDRCAASMSRSDFVKRDIVLFTPTGTGSRSFAELCLNNAGLSGLNLIRVPHLNLIPYLVQGTGAVGLMPRRLGVRMSMAERTRMVRAPVEFPPLEVALWWSSAKEHDPGQLWLREVIIGACVDLFGAKNLADLRQENKLRAAN